MACSMLPASPSWYCSRVLDCNDSGLLCFGAKHSIYTIDTSVDPPKFHGQLAAHQDRVTGLSFGKLTDNQSKLCSTAEDEKVKIWDLKDNTLCGEHAEHKFKPTSVHWSPTDKDLVASADEKGHIITWHLSTGEIKSICPETNTVFSLTFSPHMPNVLAVGYKNGLVLLLDLSRKGNPLLQKLRGHDDEIHSVVWCPQVGSELQWRKKATNADGEKGEEKEDEDRPDYLLATGSRDKTIRLWSYNKGRSVVMLRLPQSAGHRRGWEEGSKQRVWVTLYWPPGKPQELVSSSFNGDLVLWDLVRPGNKSWRLFGGNRTHSRIIFNISAAGNEGRGICSISMDRHLMLWDAETLSHNHSIPSLGGFVYCIAQSPIHSGRLAVGVGDSLVRVWNVENPQLPYDASVFWQGIKSKVTAICWHPKKEAQLAFGTDDGKVGILDIIAARSHISTTYHRKTVYVVAWGPPCHSEGTKLTDTEFVLYSCGDGNILQHDPYALDKDAISVNGLIKKNNAMENRPPGRSEISWKPDYSVVALGNEDGTIQIFRPPLMKLVCSVQVHRKLVNCVRWHPKYTADSVESSACSFWMASGSNEAVIHVVDMKNALEVAESQSSPVVVTESFCQLAGHTNRITGLAWSTHSEGRLVSVSYDWTAQVWDVKCGEGVANYRAHHGRLLSVMWSSLDPDVIYTGGDDFTIQAWNISQQTHKIPPAGSEKRKLKSKNKSNKYREKKEFPPKLKLESSNSPTSSEVRSEPTSEVASESGSLPPEVQELLDRKKAELLSSLEENPSVLNGHTTKPNAESQDQELAEGYHLEPSTSSMAYPKPKLEISPHRRDLGKKDAKDKTKRKMRSLFPLSSTMDNRGKLHTQDDCVNLMTAKADPTSSGLLPQDQSHLGHFVDRKNTNQLFDQEISHHLEQGSYDQYVMLETFKGNPAQTVRTLSEKQELNDFSVAMSAMASVHVWRSTCIAYSAQLEKEGNVQKAASYLLAAQQIYEAIDLLKRNGHYKDAVCLAKVRLSPQDPVIRSLYGSWGHQLASDGNFELSAKCYIANDQPLEAARLLARRADLSALRVAAEICLSSGDLDNARVYCHKYTQQCMTGLEWSKAAQLINKHHSLQFEGLLLTTHQTLLHQLQSVGCLGDSVDPGQGQPYVHSPSPGPGGDNKPTLPWFLLPIEAKKKWLPWQPHTINGEAFIHHLVHEWHEKWDFHLDLDSLRKMDEQMTVLSQTRQAQTELKQILVELSGYIAMVTVKMLLGHTEEACYWISVAISICQENALDRLAEGLCMLLLPTGPENITKLQQGVQALRLSAIPSDSEADQISDTSNDEPSKPTDRDIEGDNVGNDSQKCTFVDSMNAFYHYTVLKYFYKQKCRDNIPSHLLNQFSLDIKKEPLVEELNLCVPGMLELSKSLLWSAHIQKKRLQDTLTQINRATASLVSQHTSVPKPPERIRTDSSDTESSFVCPPTPNIKDVSLIAFRKENEMIMAKSKGKATDDAELSAKLHVLIPQPMPHQRILFSPVRSPVKYSLSRSSTDPEEFVEMHNPEIPEGPGIMETLPEDSGQQANVELTDSVLLDSNGPDSTLHQLANDSPKKLDSNDNKSPQNNTLLTDTLSESLEESKSVYDNIPSDWFSMPMSHKYSQDYVDLKVLSAEQENVQKQLASLGTNLKSAPFPDPEVSWMFLHELAVHSEENTDMIQFFSKHISWGEQHCYTELTNKYLHVENKMT